MKFYNKATYVAEMEKNGLSMPLNLYKGGKDDNLNSIEDNRRIKNKVIKMSKNWETTNGYFKLKNEVNDFVKKYHNTGLTPSEEVLTALFGKFTIDITKRYMEKGDLTALIATEIINENFPKSVTLQEFLKYRGNFQEINLNGQAVPLIQQATGSEKTITFKAFGLGFAQTLDNLIYNQFYTVAKINDAVSDAYIDKRNAATIGKIVGTTYTTKMKQAAATTPSGATPDFYLWKTLDDAESKLRDLKFKQTERKINVPSISLLINSRDAKRISRIMGGIDAFGKTAGKNVPALDFITNVIEYDQGINDGFYVGKELMSFPGVTKGKAYMFVPKEYFYILTKRGLTMETGQGSPLTLSQKESAWYGISGQYDDEFFGSSQAGTTLADGYGAIIEITLPV